MLELCDISPEYYDKHHKEAQKDETDIEKEMVKLMETSEELASNYQILISFKGIGPITAAALII